MSEPTAITKVDIREVWPGEARDFTPWMADNLDVIGDQLGVAELTLDSIEVPIPGGRALDVLAIDSDGERWAIENQYGVGDHDHLTRGLAYAVALDCRALIVVAEAHRDEFVAVAEEWNRYSEAFGTDGIRVFLVVVEAWRIGDSAPGYRFRIAAGPNEWISTARSGARAGRPPSEAETGRRDARLAFWSELLPVLNDQSAIFRSIGPRNGPYLSVQNGPFNHQIWVKTEACHVQLRIDGGDQEDNEALFESLEVFRSEIEERFGASLNWDKAESYRSCIIRYDVPGSVGWKTPEGERAGGIETVVRHIIALYDAFQPAIEELA